MNETTTKFRRKKPTLDPSPWRNVSVKKLLDCEKEVNEKFTKTA